MVSTIISIVALLISSAALFFTFRKDAHRLRLEALRERDSNTMDDYPILNLNNDSAFNVQVLSVGFFSADGRIQWLKDVTDYKTGRFINYPFTVTCRSAYSMKLIPGRQVPYKNSRLGYCIQLSTGRFYAVRGDAPIKIALKMYVASFISRISAGYCAGHIHRVRLPTRD